MVTSLARYTSPTQLIKDLNSYMIGFNSYYDDVLSYATQSSYPPYNVVEVDKNSYRLEMALSGYSKDSLRVYTEEGRLTVEADKQQESTSDRYLHRGLSHRSFVWSRVLSENLVVKDAKFENGLLTVNLEKVIPDNHKRKDYL